MGLLVFCDLRWSNNSVTAVAYNRPFDRGQSSFFEESFGPCGNVWL